MTYIVISVASRILLPVAFRPLALYSEKFRG
jgi:hypothetical protein